MRIGTLAVTLASLLVACGACSKKSDTAREVQNQAPVDKNLPVVVDKTKPAGTTETPPTGNDSGMTPENDASYKLAVIPAAAAAGAEAVAKVSVTPAQGWKVNMDFPTQLQVKAPDGVKLTKAVMEIGDAAKVDDHELTFDVKLVADKAGTYKCDGEIKFAVCTPDSCDPKKRAIAFELVAK
jgi:hypothetical protein